MCQMGNGHGHGHGYGGMRSHGCCVGWGAMRQGGCCGPAMPGCCGGMGFRRFISPAEELERLRDYLEELKKEMAGVEARIHDLKGHK
ncbi:MAG: hypothetical protein FJ126_08535 [Deltaproteobacteria bacterium]|nr:hypothetical protein [Deltaproteobacteria bacterium]